MIVGAKQLPTLAPCASRNGRNCFAHADAALPGDGAPRRPRRCRIALGGGGHGGTALHHPLCLIVILDLYTAATEESLYIARRGGHGGTPYIARCA